jgi:hypothetical protein
MTEWWKPHSLEMQNDRLFDPAMYSPENEKAQSCKMNGKAAKVVISCPFVEWEVSEFVTNDFCDCLLVPVVLDPYNQRLG